MMNPITARRPASSGQARTQAAPGLSSLLDRRQLRRACRDGIVLGASGAVRSLRVLPSGLDTELSYAVDTAATRRCPLVAVLPLSLPAAPMAMAAAATIAAIAAAGRVHARTAVVSARLAGRQMYQELLVDREQLSALVPRAAAGDSGEGSVVVTAHDCAQLLSLESMDDLTGLVLDLSAVDPGDLKRVLAHLRHRSTHRPLLLLAITGSPLDPAVGMIRQSGGLVYAVDQAALAAQAAVTPGSRPGDGPALVCGPDDLLRGATASLELRDCGDRALDDAVSSMWGATADVASAMGRSGSEQQASDLRWAWAVTSSFSALATSAARADFHAGYGLWSPPSLTDAPQRGRDLAVRENQSLWLHWADAAAAAVAASERESKAADVARVTADLAREGRPLLVLARNRSAAAALRSALLENPVAADVPVASMRDFAASRLRASSEAIVVVTGPVPRPYSGWLTVPPAAGLLVVNAGPQQALRSARQVIDARRALALARADAVADGLVPGLQQGSCRRPGGELPGGPGLAFVTAAGLRVPFESGGGQWDEQARQYLEDRAGEEGQLPSGRGTAQEATLWTPFQDDVLAALERRAGRTAGAADQMLENDADGGTGTGTSIAAMASGELVPVIPVSLCPLEGGAEFTVLQPPGETVTRRDGLQVKAVSARALRPGDLVALTDGQARRDLFGHVVDALEETPEWGLQAELARRWRECVQGIHRSGLSYEEIRRGSGVSVQAGTIGTWARGRVECPLNPEDVRRLARFLGDDEVLSRADAVSTSLRELWRLHRKAGRWLSARLAAASRAGLEDDAIRGRVQDDVLDPALGLRASDLLGAIRLCRVTAIGAEALAPSGATGSPLAPSDAAALCSPASGAARPG
jgi:hypothetical protein